MRLVGNPAAVDYPQVLEWAVATAALDRPRELFVMLRQVRAVAPASIQNDSGLPQGPSLRSEAG
jgi:hypothetical protein